MNVLFRDLKIKCSCQGVNGAKKRDKGDFGVRGLLGRGRVEQIICVWKMSQKARKLGWHK